MIRTPPQDRRRHRPSNAPRLFWLAGVVAGVLSYALARVYTTGALRADAALLGLVVACSVGLARHLRFSPPTDAESRRRATLFPRGRRRLMLSLAALSTLMTGLALREGLRGYPTLEPMTLFGPDAPSTSFYTATGHPTLDRLYTISGSEGERYLVPLDRYDGHLVIILAEAPSEGKLTATGRLRDNLRAVQTTSDDLVEGPFLPEYRAQMGLPAGAPVYFLDTAVRAGLNVWWIGGVVVPTYLFLLVLGAPTRRRRRPVRIRTKLQ